jgi:thioredoxin-like negative regulator of GroEL
MSELISEQQLSRLVDVGMAVAHLGRPGEAKEIFDNLLRYRPQHVPALLGLALSYLAGNKPAEAQTLLQEEVLSKTPDDPDALALLGLALNFSGREQEAAAVFERIPTDTEAGRLALAMMEK